MNDVSLLSKIGVARALRDMARLAMGITDPDLALEWAHNVGYVRPGPERGTISLTRQGMAIVHVYWKAVQQSLHAIENGTSRDHASDKERIVLPRGVRLDDQSLQEARGHMSQTEAEPGPPTHDGCGTDECCGTCTDVSENVIPAMRPACDEGEPSDPRGETV